MNDWREKKYPEPKIVNGRMRVVLFADGGGVCSDPETHYGDPDSEDGGLIEHEEIVVHWLDAKREVCSGCEGSGTCVNPSIDSNGITASEMDELGDDFRESYMSGRYDITCPMCKGQNVEWVIDEERADEEVLEAISESRNAEYEYDAMAEAERRAGC